MFLKGTFNIGIFNDDLPERGKKGKKKLKHERIKKVLLPDRFVGVTSFSSPKQFFSSRVVDKNLRLFSFMYFINSKSIFGLKLDKHFSVKYWQSLRVKIPNKTK